MKPINYFRILFAMTALILFTSGPINAAEMDDRIESSAKESYIYKTYLKDDDIKINSTDGVVTLTGNVADENHKSLAEETVANLPGVTKVDNQLQAKVIQPVKASDEWIALKVKGALLFHRNVSATRTYVDAKDGVVTLSGTAYSQSEKDLATEYAQDVEGVKDVKNEMIIEKMEKTSTEKFSEEVDDASITSMVKLSLLSHRSTSALRTKVKTDNGIVTVSGKAKDPAEKDLVTKLVKDIDGVKNVVNNMEIQ